MKKILITGVAGFIGSNFARELIKENYHVYGIDDLSQGFEKIFLLRSNLQNAQ